MTDSDFANSDLGRELVASLRAAELARADALREAVRFDRDLPRPVVPDQIANCTHYEPPCDCPKPTADEHAGMARLVEEATVERIMRNAERFFDWIRNAVTPAWIQDEELRDLQDGDG